MKNRFSQWSGWLALACVMGVVGWATPFAAALVLKDTVYVQGTNAKLGVGAPVNPSASLPHLRVGRPGDVGMNLLSSFPSIGYNSYWSGAAFTAETSGNFVAKLDWAPNTGYLGFAVSSATASAGATPTLNYVLQAGPGGVLIGGGTAIPYSYHTSVANVQNGASFGPGCQNGSASVTVNGAVLGDACFINSDNALGNYKPYCRILTANTVAVDMCSTCSAGACGTVPSATFYIWVFGH